LELFTGTINSYLLQEPLQKRPGREIVRIQKLRVEKAFAFSIGGYYLVEGG
jgi:hypothetical protein